MKIQSDIRKMVRCITKIVKENGNGKETTQVQSRG